MKHLLIIGARGFGREVYGLAKESLGYGTDFDIKGYLDDKSDALDNYFNYPSIISSVESYVPEKNDVFICALGDVSFKEKYASIILNKGGEFITLIHHTVSIGLNTIIGTGCILEKNAVISCDAIIGNFVTVMPHAVLGHDIQVGDWSHIGTFAFMGGFSKLGRSVTLHPTVNILPHKKVGDNATVGAGSVVIRSVKEGCTVFGIPAMKI